MSICSALRGCGMHEAELLHVSAESNLGDDYSGKIL
jgi:hypothetical protein